MLRIKAGIKEKHHYPIGDKVASIIVSRVLQAQVRFSDWLNKKAERIPSHKLKVLLLLFCISSGSFSIYLIGKAFHKSHSNVRAWKIDAISIPKHVNPSIEKQWQPNENIAESDFKRLQAIKAYLDSIRRNGVGKGIYDSVMNSHPHLIDSINLLQQLYLSQLKK